MSCHNVCCSYIEVIHAVMSDDCRYLVETFEFDKNVHGGILLLALCFAAASCSTCFSGAL